MKARKATCSWYRPNCRQNSAQLIPELITCDAVHFSRSLSVSLFSLPLSLSLSLSRSLSLPLSPSPSVFLPLSRSLSNFRAKEDHHSYCDVCLHTCPKSFNFHCDVILDFIAGAQLPPVVCAPAGDIAGEKNGARVGVSRRDRNSRCHGTS